MLSYSGFSTFEVFITLLVISIMLGSASLQAPRWRSARQVKIAARNLKHALDHWALEARYLQEDVHVVFEDDSFVAIRRSALSPASARRRLPKGIVYHEPRFANLLLGQHVLTLRKNGSATPGRVRLTAKNGKDCELIRKLRGTAEIKCRD